jgi:hypothetical protein
MAHMLGTAAPPPQRSGAACVVDAGRRVVRKSAAVRAVLLAWFNANPDATRVPADVARRVGELQPELKPAALQRWLTDEKRRLCSEAGSVAAEAAAAAARGAAAAARAQALAEAEQAAPGGGGAGQPGPGGGGAAAGGGGSGGGSGGGGGALSQQAQPSARAGACWRVSCAPAPRAAAHAAGAPT